jgi:putative transposase
MVNSQARRDQVALAMERGHTQRQACELMELPRSILNYRSVRAERDASVLDAMRRIAATYPRYGYRRVRIFLRREGHAMGPIVPIDSGAWPDCNYHGAGRGDG